MMPKVSIIVPCYGVEKYLDRCMESIVNQTLKEIEIVMVDDKSPDRVPQMCDEWARRDSRIKVIHKPVNQGLGLARNTGLEAVTGEYVMFIDSDDYIDADSIQTLYDCARKNDLDICYGSFCYEFNDGRIVKKLEVEKETYFFGRKQVDEFELDMVGACPSFPREVKYSVSVCKGIFRLEVFRKHYLLFDNEKEMASEDTLFHLLILPCVERVGFIPYYFYHYCENDLSISHTYSEKAFLRTTRSDEETKRRLSSRYPETVYLIHYQRRLFLNLRCALSAEISRADISFFQKLANVGKRCAHPAYADLFKSYPYWQLGAVKAVLYLAMKHRISLVAYFVLAMTRRMKR